MKIVVAFKIVPEYEKIPSKDLLKGDFYLGKEGFGFFTEGALELARRLSDDLEALSFFEADSIFIEKLYSLGFKKVTILKGNNTDFNSKETARVLSDYLKTTNYDLLLFGSMVGPNDTGMVPYYVARNLGLKIIPNITYGEIVESKLKLYAEDLNESHIYDVDSKVLGIVNNARFSYLSFARYEDTIKAKGKKAFHINVDSKKEYYRLKKKEEVKKETSFIDTKTLNEILRRSK